MEIEGGRERGRDERRIDRERESGKEGESDEKTGVAV